MILGKLTGYFYNHINKRPTFIATKTLHHMAYHVLLARLSIPDYQKDIKGLMQIKRAKCYSLMLLSKNQLYQHKNQITKSLPLASKTT